MTAMQSLLERACFDFTKTMLPGVLMDKKWTCPEAIELHEWTRIMIHFRNSPWKDGHGTSLDTLSDSEIAFNDGIRHTAVHRTPRMASEILELVISAEKLLSALRDTTRAAKIDQLYHEISAAVEDMMQTKKMIKKKLDEDLKAIGKWRAEFDSREQEAIALSIRDNEHCETLVSALLDQAVADMATDYWPHTLSEYAAYSAE